MNLFRFKFNFSYPLTVLGAALFLFIGVQTASQLWTYARLRVQIPVTIDKWKVIKKSSSSFPIKASYHLEFQGKTYHHRELLLPPYHLNRPSAEKAAQQLQALSWTVWIDLKNPSISALQKVFPTKKIVYTLIAFGITAYFGFLETSSRIRNPTN